MSLIGSGFWDVPGSTVVVQTLENILWWGGDPKQVKRWGAVLLSTSTDSASSPTTLLRIGTLMGKILTGASAGKITPWSPTATDGSQLILGPLMVDQNMLNQAQVAADKFFGYCMVGGPVKASGLIIPGQSSAGIAGQALEHLIRTQMSANGAFQFDDGLFGNAWGGWSNTRIMTGAAQAFTIVAGSGLNNCLFRCQCTGGPPGIAFTLPAPAIGLRYGFYAENDAGFSVTGAAANQLIGYNNAATASTITVDTTAKSIGCLIELIGVDASHWLTVVHLANLAQVVTIS